MAIGIVDEISSAMRKGPEFLSQFSSIKVNTKSIAKGAKDSTFQFPCLITDSAPGDMAATIVRTLDQVYASFAQTWLSMNSMFDITIDPTPLDYLKKMHQNLRLESSNLFVDDDDVSHYMEKVYDGTYRLYMDRTGTYGVVFNHTDKYVKELMESHKELLREHLSDYNLAPLESIYTEADDVDFAQAVIGNTMAKNRASIDLDRAKSTEKLAGPKLLDRDIKRNNDMVPYGIEVRLIAVNDKKEFVQYVDFIVGIKTILHLVQSQDMIENIARAVKNKSILFKLLRWTTGELSLAKDIILNLGNIKQDAISRTNGRSPFFNTFKRLKNKRVGLKSLSVPHALIPNATIVITSYEADYLENNMGIEIRNSSTAKKLIDAMFLMAFVIMDEGSGTISILYDGDSAFQTYSLETLERDNALNSNKLGREIGRMISH